MTKNYHRSFSIRQLDEQTNGDAIRIAISSEEPYMRFYLGDHERAYEVLGHRVDEIDMTYFTEGAPLAVEHDVRDQVGVLENVSLDSDRVLRADIRFSKSQRGQEMQQDVLDGIRTRISVGYEILEMEDAGTHEDGIPIVRATKWRPYEASIVAVPADITVGVGKNLNSNGADSMELTDATVAKLQAFLKQLDEDAVEEVTEETIVAAEALLETVSDLADEVMTVETDVEDEEEDEVEDEARVEHGDEEEMKGMYEDKMEGEEEKAVDSSDLDYVDDGTKSHKASKSRKTGVSMKKANGSHGAKETAQLARIANEYGRGADLASWIENGRSVSDVMEEILDSRSNAHKAVVNGPSAREQKEVSFARSIEGLLSGDNSLVNEMGRSVAESHGISTKANALYIPLNAPVFRSQRVYGFGATPGSNLVANEYLTLEEALREQSIIGQLGVQVQEVSNVLVMPRLAGVSATWVGEEDAVSEASSSISTITWSPKTLAVDVPYTRQLKALDGTYDVEEIVRQDILGALLEGTETAIFAGSGSNQPQGLEFDSNIPSIAASTGSVDYQSFVQLARTQRENKGTATNHFYVVTPGIYETGTVTPRFSSTAGPGIIHEGMINGVPVLQSNFLTATSGAQKALYGNFNKVLVAHFGVMEIMVNPYRQSANRRVTLEGTMFMDSHARQPNDIVRHLGLNVT